MWEDTQDLLITQTQCKSLNKQPWMDVDFNCSAANMSRIESFGMDSKVSSRQMGSLRLEENMPPVLTVGTVSIPLGEALSASGIESLFSRLSQLVHRFRRTKNAATKLEIFQVLGALEHLASVSPLNDDSKTAMNGGMTKILKKIGILERGSTDAENDLHLSLFVWTTCYNIIVNNNAYSNREEELQMVICSGLFIVMERRGTVFPCSCFQQLLIRLFKETKFLDILMKSFTTVIDLEEKSKGNDNKEGLRMTSSGKALFSLPLSASIEYLSFLADCLRHFIEIRAISEDGSTILANQYIFRRFFLLAARLAPRQLGAVCQQLAPFLAKYTVSGIEALSKPTKNLCTLVLKDIESNPLPELESLLSYTPREWSLQISSLFSSIDSPRIHMIRTISCLLNDSSCWPGLRLVLFNKWNGPQLVSNSSSFGTLFSLLLSIIGAEEMGSRLCQWLREGFAKGNPTTLFLVVDTIGELTRNGEIEVDWKGLNRNLLLQLPLPSCGSLFIDRLLVSPIQNTNDIDNAASQLTPTDFLRFLSVCTENDWQVGGANKCWQRANSLLLTSSTVEEQDDGGKTTTLSTFLANELRFHLSSPSSSESALRRLHDLKESLWKKGSIRRPSVVLPLCNSLLRSPRSYTLPSDLFVDLWIYSVCVFYDAPGCEQSVSLFTSQLWESLCLDISARSPSLTHSLALHNSQPDPEDYLKLLFKAMSQLGSAPNHSQWVGDRLAAWVPLSLADQIFALILADPKKDLALRVCVSLVQHLSPILWSRLGKSLNNSPVKVFIQIVCDKKLSANPSVSSSAVSLIKTLSRIPFHLFISARIKDLLLLLHSQGISCDVTQAFRLLSEPSCKAYLDRLLKDSATSEMVRAALPAQS